MSDMRLTMVLGQPEAEVLAMYAQREGLSIKDAAHRLVVEEMHRAARSVPCPTCGGTGRTVAERG